MCETETTYVYGISIKSAEHTYETVEYFKQQNEYGRHFKLIDCSSTLVKALS